MKQILLSFSDYGRELPMSLGHLQYRGFNDYLKILEHQGNNNFITVQEFELSLGTHPQEI